MDGKITCREDIEAMLEGLDPAERHRAIVGAIADIDDEIAALQARNREITRRRMELAEKMGYPNGWNVD
jgi:hypothetical protein